MGRKSTTGGVAPLGSTRIQLYFRYRLQRCRPTLEMKPTPANLEYARRLVKDIEERIRHDRFDLAKEFPAYKGLARFGHAPGAPAAPKSFDLYADLFLAAKGKMSPSTIRGYRKILDGHWRTWFGERPIASVLPSEVKVKLAAMTAGRKTHNNVLDVGRQVFALAFADGVIQSNPMAGIAFLELPDPEPDPFTLDEVDLILPALEKRWGAEVRDYFEFAFFSGLRPSEQIELAWPDVDLPQRAVKITRARVVGTVKDTKTYENRYLELHSRAYAALERQRVRTQLAGGYVFLNPFTKEKYADERSQRRFLVSVLKTLGVRHRPAKNTRHTYATMLLMAGANPAWAAKQLGHSVEMFLRTYSKWIVGADRGSELAKVEAFTNAGSIPTDATGQPSTGQSAGQSPRKRRF